MRIIRRGAVSPWRLEIAAASFCFLAACPGIAQREIPECPPQVIQDVRVFDGKNVLEHRWVLIQHGKIGRIESKPIASGKTERIDGKGRTLIPGLIDAHVHMPDHTEAAARQALVLGVTTELDMFSAGERLRNNKRLEAEDRPDLADLRTAGVGATVPGGHPTQMGGPSFPLLKPGDNIQAFVDDRIREGSDYIKIMHDDGSTWPWTKQRVPMLDIRTMKALIEAAHKRGKLAVVHVLSESQARDAILAGADGLAHLFLGDTVSRDFSQLAAAHHVFIIPTLTTLYLNCGRSPGPAILSDPSLGPHIDSQWHNAMSFPKADPSANHLCRGTDEAFRQLVQAGVPILTGTDAPAPGATYGASVHAEMELFVADGMTPLQALAAATSAPARAFKLTDRGSIHAGMRADLVLVDGDPTQDILATRRIVKVWKRGFPVEPDAEGH